MFALLIIYLAIGTFVQIIMLKNIDITNKSIRFKIGCFTGIIIIINYFIWPFLLIVGYIIGQKGGKQ